MGRGKGDPFDRLGVGVSRTSFSVDRSSGSFGHETGFRLTTRVDSTRL